MLTWAYVYLVTHSSDRWGNGNYLILAMFYDVAIFYYFARALMH